MKMNMNIRKNKSLPAHSPCSDGFTLIELVVTIVIIGIVVLALVMSFQESLKAMERQGDLQTSAVLSEDFMHEIRSKSFDAVAGYDGAVTNISGFTRRVAVDNVLATNFNVATASTTGFKRITVAVSNAMIAVSNMSVVSRYD